MNDPTRLMHRRRRPRAGTAAAILAAAALVTLAAGCGSSARPSGSPSGSSGGGSVYAQGIAYANCMRTEGVPAWPDPNRSGQFDASRLGPQQLGVSSSQLLTAQRACRDLLPNGVKPLPNRTQAMGFSQCMRSHGIANFPDPNGSGGLRVPDAVERSPGYGDAVHTCQSLLPAP